MKLAETLGTSRKLLFRTYQKLFETFLFLKVSSTLWKLSLKLFETFWNSVKFFTASSRNSQPYLKLYKVMVLSYETPLCLGAICLIVFRTQQFYRPKDPYTLKSFRKKSEYGISKKVGKEWKCSNRKKQLAAYSSYFRLHNCCTCF